MFFGKRRLWRLLSPVAVLLWVMMVVGFAGITRADAAAYSANDCGTDHPYASNFDENTPSENCKGEGPDKPAGSVGNADDKCPPGQEPDGSDHNKGYECDKNQGVGQGNPAHTRNCPSGGNGGNGGGGGGGGQVSPPTQQGGAVVSPPAAPGKPVTKALPNTGAADNFLLALVALGSIGLGTALVLRRGRMSS